MLQLKHRRFDYRPGILRSVVWSGVIWNEDWANDWRPSQDENASAAVEDPNVFLQFNRFERRAMRQAHQQHHSAE